MKEIYIYGEIGTDVTSNGIRKELQALNGEKEIAVRINSGGGSVFEGNAIRELLANHPAKIHIYIDSLAASIASVIAMVGDTVNIAKNGMIMIHDAFLVTAGNHRELRKQADDLERINETVINAYLDRGVKLSRERLVDMMKNETWLDAEDAKKYGFVDNITEPRKVAAAITEEQKAIYNRVPKVLNEDVTGQLQEDEAKEIAERIVKLLEEVSDKLDIVIENTSKEEEQEQEEEQEKEQQEQQEQQDEPVNLTKLFLNIGGMKNDN